MTSLAPVQQPLSVPQGEYVADGGFLDASKPRSLVNTDELMSLEQSEPATPTDSEQSANSYLPLNHVAASVDRPMSGATKLKKMLLESNELIVCPGVYDGLSARTAIELGFNGLYMVSEAIPQKENKSPGSGGDTANARHRCHRRALAPLRLASASRTCPLRSSTRCVRMPR